MRRQQLTAGQSRPATNAFAPRFLGGPERKRPLLGKNSAMTPVTRPSRIIGLDVCRSLAILTVMISHSITEAGVFGHYAPDNSATNTIRMLIQIAPPIFIILFGSMLEIVYRPQVEAGEGRSVTARLLTRALQCYLLYLVRLVAMLAAGLNTVGYTLRCALMMGITPYTDILKFYALALAFAPALLFLRNRFGLTVLVAVSVAVHFAYPLLSHIIIPGDSEVARYANPVIGFLIGGDQIYVGGPSVLHAMSFVVWGLLIGRIVVILTQETIPRQQALNAIGALLLMLVASIITMEAFWNLSAPLDTVIHLADMSIRNHNEPIYFAFGLAGALLAIIACLVLYDANGFRFGRSLTFAGRTSLFTFSFGNSLLYLAPPLSLNTSGAWLYALLLFALICLQSYAFYALQTSSSESPGKLVGWFQVSLGSINETVARLPRLIAPRYAGLLGW